MCLTRGLEDVYERRIDYHLLTVQMVPSARKAVMGDGVCIGLTFKSSPFVHPKTQRNRELADAVVAEVRSHPEFKDIAFTSIQINHNTVRDPRTDNNLILAPLQLPSGWGLRRRTPSS